MPTDRLDRVLADEVAAIDARGSSKRAEAVVVEVIPAQAAQGPRYRLAGEGERLFVKMNSNNYLGLALSAELRAAEEEAVRRYGVGPGAVRFISGTYAPHVALEQRLAEFHGRAAAMLFSAAYVTVMGAVTPLVSGDTVVISDELNHNCIINAMRLSRPRDKQVYRHGDLGELEAKLAGAAGRARRALVVTDGIFSMRGDHAPLAEIAALCRGFDGDFPENVVLVVDDSHGVGAYGASGRGTEEHCGARADVLIATLGKALGVNGGYVTGSRTLIDFLRETAPMYIYSNPITAGEAAAAVKAVDLLDSERGGELLAHLRAMTARFSQGLRELGFETLPGSHPVVPLMVRDTPRTQALVRHLRACGVLATGLNYPVVPRGDEEIRFQVSADHTAADIDFVLDVLASFRDG